jgi:hypothetical protein
MELNRLAAATIAVMALSSATPAGSAVEVTGVLAGQTQISYGCPGPVRVGGPTCNPWRSFPNGRFRLTARETGGFPVAGRSRVVVSDGTGWFELRLAVGSYIVTPLAQDHTRGGPTLTIQVSAAKTTRIWVRFQGFPMMA